MLRHSRAMTAAFFLIVAAACSKSDGPTAPTPAAPTPIVAAPSVPVLTLEPDTTSPVGQSVAVTFASRAQEAGKIAVAVTGFNLQNQISPSVFGLTGVQGRLKWDDTLLEIDARGIGDFLGGNSGGGPCTTDLAEPPGT